MAKHKSAIKRHRQSLNRQARNTSIKARLRTLVKKARTAVTGGQDSAADDVARASRALDKAVTKGVLHRNNAARKISRLARRANATKTASA